MFLNDAVPGIIWRVGADYRAVGAPPGAASRLNGYAAAPSRGRTMVIAQPGRHRADRDVAAMRARHRRDQAEPKAVARRRPAASPRKKRRRMLVAVRRRNARAVVGRPTSAPIGRRLERSAGSRCPAAYGRSRCRAGWRSLCASSSRSPETAIPGSTGHASVAPAVADRGAEPVANSSPARDRSTGANPVRARRPRPRRCAGSRRTG